MCKTMLVGLLVLGAAVSTCQARTLDDIRSAGVVTCGLDPGRPGLSFQDGQLRWTGIFVDLCRALAAAVFADPTRTNLVALAPDEHVVALQSGEIDVLIDGEPLTAGKDAAEGLMWVHPFLHDSRSGFASYAPLVRQGDDQWFQAVREVELELIRAAEQGFTQQAALLRAADSSAAVPEAAGLGLSAGWQVHIVAAVGNHGEVLRRNLGTGSDTGANAVWNAGGLHWAPPPP
jgi:hypothetical protein